MHALSSRSALRFLAFVLALGLCGCGGLHWHKPDGSDASVSRDLEVCRNEAQTRFRSASALAMPSPGDPRFGPTGPSQADLRMQESQATGTCMRAKGYVLVPDEK
jgi:hypothetical protein